MSNKITISLTIENYDGLVCIEASLRDKKINLIASDFRKGILSAIDELCFDALLDGAKLGEIRKTHFCYK